MPGRTSPVDSSVEGGDGKRAFNGGPGNCPAEQNCTMCRCSARSWSVAPCPSMEGRAIARPRHEERPRAPSFNGGPGNCPAEPRWTAVFRRAGPFNGGPGNCPAEPWRPRTHHASFNGGPGNCPARAGVHGDRGAALRGMTFNGGPGNCREPAPRSSRSFNGGPGNCPAEPVGHEDRRPSLQWRAGQLPGRTIVAQPSMEGRAIARPNRPSTFNGGPGNCPAEQPAIVPVTLIRATLQWRAGQLPGRTAWSVTLQGRAIARPNQSTPRRSTASLQWRAGQLPGRTSTVRHKCGRGVWTPARTFNGGPGNCPAERPYGPFNGGPGNCAAERGSGRQWRAGQLPGRTFNGGPGNCPAEPVTFNGNCPAGHGTG